MYQHRREKHASAELTNPVAESVDQRFEVVDVPMLAGLHLRVQLLTVLIQCRQGSIFDLGRSGSLLSDLDTVYAFVVSFFLTQGLGHVGADEVRVDGTSVVKAQVDVLIFGPSAFSTTLIQNPSVAVIDEKAGHHHLPSDPDHVEQDVAQVDIPIVNITAREDPEGLGCVPQNLVVMA